MNRLLSLGNKKADASVISSFSYTHDNVGNRLSMTTLEGTHNYAYDNTYRLTSATHPAQPAESFTYDKVGNRKTSSQHSDWAYDANNRLTSYNGFTFTYDNNGNTLTKSEGANTTTYAYDYENRLLQAISPTSQANYTYDPFGKRLSKTVNSSTTYYLYDNEDIIAEYNSTGALIASYLHGQGIDEPISMTRGGSTYYYTFDGLGSVTELTDSTGTAVESYKYDAFGKLETPPATGNPYTYTGREYDPETGVYFYRARYYDAGVGRFMSEDPIRSPRINIGSDMYSTTWLFARMIKSPDLLHSYLYVKNNPINFIDSYGYELDRPCFGRCIGRELKELLKRKMKWYGICILGCAGFCGFGVIVSEGAGLPFFAECTTTCIEDTCLLSKENLDYIITYLLGDLVAITKHCLDNCKKGCK